MAAVAMSGSARIVRVAPSADCCSATVLLPGLSGSPLRGLLQRMAPSRDPRGPRDGSGGKSSDAGPHG